MPDYNSLFDELYRRRIQVRSLSQPGEGLAGWRAELFSVREDGVILIGLGSGPSAYFALVAARVHYNAELSRPAYDLRKHVGGWRAPRNEEEDFATTTDRGRKLLAVLGLKAKPKFTAGLL